MSITGQVSVCGFRLHTMVRGAEEPGTESFNQSWMSGVWGRVNESGNNIVKSMYSPHRILSVKPLARGASKAQTSSCTWSALWQIRSGGCSIGKTGGLERKTLQRLL